METEKDIYQEGKQIADTDPDGAIEFFQKELNKTPNDWRCFDEIGLIYFHKMRDFEQAMKYYNLAKDINPDNYELYQGIGCCLQLLHRLEEAIVVYKKSIEMFPHNSTILSNLGYCYTILKNYSESTRYYYESLKIKPNDEQVLYYLSKSLMNQQEYEVALQIISISLQRNPTQQNLRFLAGKCLFYLEDEELAIQYLYEELSIFPDGDTCYKLAKFFFDERLFKHAINMIETAIQFEPDSKEFINFAALIYAEARLIDQAIYYFKKLIEQHPKEALIYNNYASALLKAGRYLEAKEQYEIALTIQPDQHVIVAGLANIYYYLQQPNEAIPLYLKALEINPKYDLSYKKIADCYQLMNEKDKVIEYKLKALEINRNSANLNEVGFTYLQREEYESSLQYFEEASKLEPKNKSFINNKGIALHKLKRNKECIDCFIQILKLSPNDQLSYQFFRNTIVRIEHDNQLYAAKLLTSLINESPIKFNIYHTLAIIYVNLNDFEKSEELFQKSLNLEPHNEDLLEDYNEFLQLQ